MNDPKFEYYGTMSEDGKMKLPRKRIQEEVQVLSGGPIMLTIERKRKRRSNAENNYYWGVIIRAFLAAFCDFDPETGWTASMVHEVLKLRFLPLVREWGQGVTPNGEVIDEPLTTTKLTTVEAEDYYEHCRKWAAEMDILIPLPNEQMEIFEL